MKNLTERRPQLNKKQADGIFYISLLMLSLFAFLFLGADGYVMFDDSGSYIDCLKYVEGVMPVYPLFLWMNRAIFGELQYLHIVVIEQAVWAAICIIIFNAIIKKQFGLKYLEAYVVFALSLLPFAINLPEEMVTQEILTEGIAYATFYLFMGVLLKVVWTKHLQWVWGLVLITLLLAATRSQLQILFAVCGIIFFYVMVTRQGKVLHSKIAVFLIGIVGCVFISFAGVWMISRTSVLYQTMIRNIGIQIETEKMAATLEEREAEQDIGIEGEENQTAEIPRAATVSQYVSLIFSRGMYEAEYEDSQLFADGELRDLYLFFYEVADENECLYTYAQPGLWMWKDIVGGIGSVGQKCFYALDGYVNASDMMEIGMTLLKAHWTRFLYHTIMLLPQAFVSTIFFQIEKIYWLCHLITLFFYLTAIAFMIWAFRDKKIDRAYAEFMAAALGTNVVMVVVISIGFFGQQRYLVYNFGIFYVIYFLMLLQLWKTYGKNWLQKWKNRRKS